MKILECTSLTKEYISGENTVKAVDDISVSFDKGEFCAVTGPSGSGKSTLLHLLSSLEAPTEGDIIYNDVKLSNYNDNQLSILRRRRFGFVFQAYNLVQELTGYENILLPEFAKLPLTIIRARQTAVPMVGGRDRVRVLIKCRDDAPTRRLLREVYLGMLTDKDMRDVTVGLDMNPTSII